MRTAITGIVCGMLLAGPASGATLQITELMLNSPPGAGVGGGYPDYVEISYTPALASPADGFGPGAPFTLVVMDALAGRERSVWSVVEVEPAADRQTLVIHNAADAWPTGGTTGQRVEHGGTLGLGAAFATARRLILFDGPVSLVAGTQASAWPTTANALEMIELSINGGVVAPFSGITGVPTDIPTIELSIDVGEALYRLRDGLGGYSDEFLVGAPDALLNGITLNPMLTNVADVSALDTGGEGGGDQQTSTVHMPEPTSAAALAVVFTALAAGRSTGRRRSAPRRPHRAADGR